MASFTKCGQNFLPLDASLRKNWQQVLAPTFFCISMRKMHTKVTLWSQKWGASLKEVPWDSVTRAQVTHTAGQSIAVVWPCMPALPCRHWRLTGMCCSDHETNWKLFLNPETFFHGSMGLKLQQQKLSLFVSHSLSAPSICCPFSVVHMERKPSGSD